MFSKRRVDGKEGARDERGVEREHVVLEEGQHVGDVGSGGEEDGVSEDDVAGRQRAHAFQTTDSRVSFFTKVSRSRFHHRLGHDRSVVWNIHETATQRVRALKDRHSRPDTPSLRTDSRVSIFLTHAGNDSCVKSHFLVRHAGARPSRQRSVGERSLVANNRAVARVALQNSTKSDV